MTFNEGYKQLNAAQKQAVDTIDGPVLVVAGPGTGKTQLLAMRGANIVRQTDTPPSAVLCLTFTESAAAAMRQRLIDLMGPEGNKIAVQTFHSFGADVINKYPEYFYNGARFSPADDMTGYEILREIFEALPHSNPLSKTMNGEFTALRDAQNAISHLKRAGLTPDELLTILSHNSKFCDAAEPLVAKAFAERLSKKDIPKISQLAQQLPSADTEPLFGYKNLAEICTDELSRAAEEANATGKTTPLTAWRNRWCEKNGLGKLVFKNHKQTKKLRALADIYKKYRAALTEEELFDFDDMVSLVAHTLETTPELRLNLQEQYLYIMVDEFQDTNGAQARLLNALADNPINEGRPDILAVGDDDQAIYAFQGAELSNILNFTERYKNPAIITLTDNYRSTQTVLKQARHVITQAEQRLETNLENISKELTAHNKHSKTAAELHNFETPQAEYNWVTEQIKTEFQNKKPANEIAVLARNHKQLIELLPHLHDAGIYVNYERRSNVLESAHIRELITLADVVVNLSEQRFDLVESLLPELLSFKFWGIETSDLWQLSLNSYKQRRMWLELMIESDGKLRQIAEFIIVASHKALHEPCDVMLDILIGSNEQQVGEDEAGENSATDHPDSDFYEDFVSPYRAFYFNQKRLQQNPGEYLTLLGNLRAIRQALKNYRPGNTLDLRNFIDFVQLHERTNTPIIDSAAQHDNEVGINLMTAHKAKGLEFDTVFVLSCQDEIWGRKTRRPSSSLSFPYNLPITPAGATYDDALRLFFVAITRAKKTLYMSSHQTNNSGKTTLLAEFLQYSAENMIPHDGAATTNVEQLAPGWQLRHLNLPSVKQESLLRPTLEAYKLSATHLNNFTDVTRGGPQAFLLQNLLRFPQAMTSSQVFGHAIHNVLARAHIHLTATDQRRPVEDILHDFEIHLQNARLGEREFTYLFEKGSDVLQAYFGARYESFNVKQKAERNFAGQNVVIDGIKLTGAIDLMEVDETAKTITVTDYKTGKGHSHWRGITDFDKIKMHKYRQQLMLYKLLIENSRDFAGYTVTKGALEFVEPDTDQQLHKLEMAFDPTELGEFRQLLGAVWRKIQALDFPDTNTYPASYQGLQEFEKNLINDL